MLTAAITAAIAGLLALFGITPTVGQLAVVAIVVKILIVMSGLLFAARLAKRRRDAAPPAEQAKAPSDPSAT